MRGHRKVFAHLTEVAHQLHHDHSTETVLPGRSRSTT